MANVKGASAELETIVMSSLVGYPIIMSKVYSVIETKYFTNPTYKVIFTVLSKFYADHLCIPSKLVLTSEMKKKENLPEDFKETIDTIYAESKKLPDEQYASDCVSQFVTRARSEGVLSAVVDNIRANGSVDSDKIVSQLNDVYSFSMNNLSVLNLGDITQFEEVRKEAVGDEASSRIIKFFVPDVNDTFQYGGLLPGTLNCVAAPPGRGKTSLLINQGASTAKQGFNHLHVFLGDMSKYDGLLRYLSSLTGKPTSEFIRMSINELSQFVQRINQTGILDRITILTYPADTVSANELMEDIRNLQRENNVHYDSIIVDYDENIKAEVVDNVYANGGALYNKLAAFAVVNKSVVWIASQPKVGAWSESEILPLDCLAESSKKQKIIDFLITLGKNKTTSGAGTLYIAKNRRGRDSKIYRLKIVGDTCQMFQIDEEEYNQIKQSEAVATTTTPTKKKEQASNVPW